MSRKPEYVSAVEAAKITGLSEKTIRRKLERGELKAEKQGISYAIRVRDLDKLMTGQRPPTTVLLLQRIGDLEANQERLAGQIEALERRLQELEARPVGRVTTRPLTGSGPVKVLEIPAQPVDDPLSDDQEGRAPTQPLAALESLPPGSMKAAHFARQYGINPRTFNGQIGDGRVKVTSVSRKGRPEHWLTPEQQEQVKSDRGL